MTIRPAILSDIPAILALTKKVVPAMNAAGNYQWSDDYPNQSVFEDDIALQQLWVAMIDNHVAGIAAITTDQSPEYADVGWDITELAIVVHRLAVDTDYRGMGVAKALMLQAEQEAVKKNTHILRVDTNSMNAATQKLFPQLGYSYAGEIGLAFRPGLRFYCYEKRI